MSASGNANPKWGSSYRLVAAEKWKAKSAAMGSEVTRQLVEFSQPVAGMRVLDLACGTGEPGISLAGRVGPSGHVTAFDLSAELLELADGRARARGLSNFSTRQGDAHALPFDDQGFDLVTCRFGVMFFSDVHCALRETRRVLRPGARACFVAWGPFEQPYWQNTMAVAHRAAGGPLLAENASGMFRFAPPGSLSAALREAGFSSADEELRTVDWPWPGDVAEVWEYAQAVSTPFRAMLDRIPEAEWPAVNRQVHEALAPFFDGKGVNLKVQVVMAAGTR